jgi:tellurite methyltransferase
VTEADFDWHEFHRRSLVRPSRELLRRTLGCFELGKRRPGVAVDLGCGAGPETLELLRRGWQVHVVDSDAQGIEMLQESVPPSARPQLCTYVAKLEEFRLPRCDLIWAGYSLPYCPASHWSGLWSRIVAALRQDGRFAGDIFGDQHAWAGEPGVFTMTEAVLRDQLGGLVIEAFDIENGVRPSGGALTRWHAFGVAVRQSTVKRSAGNRRVGA